MADEPLVKWDAPMVSIGEVIAECERRYLEAIRKVVELTPPTPASPEDALRVRFWRGKAAALSDFKAWLWYKKGLTDEQRNG